MASSVSQRLSISRASVSNVATPAGATQTTGTPTLEARNQRGTIFQWVVGCIFLVLVAVIWNFSSVLIQYIFNDLSFEAPFFVTSLGMALFAVNLPIYYVTKVLWPAWRSHLVGSSSSSELPQVKAEAAAVEAELATESPHSKAMLKRTMLASVIVAPLWFFANFTYNESLNLTSVTSSTILSATSSVFTLILAVWLLKERFTWLKVLGVAMCMAGNCATLANDSSGGISDHFWGDIMALLGAILYGVYTTAIRRLLPDGVGISVSLFFGFVGLFSFVGLFIFVIIFNYTGVESLENLTAEIWGLLILQGLVNNVLADYLWAVAIMYTSTTVATIGLSLTVPMAIISDWAINGLSPNYITLISSVLVLGGFIILALVTRKEQLQKLAAEKNGVEAEVETSVANMPLTPKSPTTEYKEATRM